MCSAGIGYTVDTNLQMNDSELIVYASLKALPRTVFKAQEQATKATDSYYVSVC